MPDHRRDEFSSIESIREIGTVTIGIASQEYVGYTASTLFPNAEFVIVPSPRDFFERTGPGEDVDAWITSAQEGAAWTLLYPAFGVVSPFSRSLAVPLVYPTQPAGDGAMKRFIDPGLAPSNARVCSMLPMSIGYLGKEARKFDPGGA